MESINICLDTLTEEERELALELSKKPVCSRKRKVAGETYWYITDAGAIKESKDNRLWADDYRWATGNYYNFRDQDIVSLETKRKEVLQEIKDFAQVANKGKELDWEYSASKYFIIYDYSKGIVDVDSTEYYMAPEVAYFADRTDAHNAIEYIGADRIKNYVFGVC